MSAVRKDLRHRARETALQILYAWDIGHTDIAQAANTFFTHQWVGDGPTDDLKQWATELARETVDRLDAIDPLIADTTERWRPERMAVLDHVALALLVDGRDHHTAARRAREALLACEVEHSAGMELRELSDGERQQVLLARAPAVVQHEQPGRLAGGGALGVAQLAQAPSRGM